MEELCVYLGDYGGSAQDNFRATRVVQPDMVLVRKVYNLGTSESVYVDRLKNEV